jgi:RHS repeat-associated protein
MLSISNQPLKAIPHPESVTYEHDEDNRLLSAGDATFGYDDNGNLTSKTVDASVTSYAWDKNGMLKQLNRDGVLYDYAYDPLLRRVSRTVNGVETRYVYERGGALLAETDDTGTVTAYYVYGLGLLSKITPAGDAYYYHYDGLGSTVAITDANENVVNSYAYGIFGQILESNETIDNPFKYVGAFGVMDEGNGTYYMTFRYYDSEIGRFISKDPIGLAGGINMYSLTK